MSINVNKQIEEAMERGEFSNLPGEGKPLKLDTNPFLTPQARMTNRLLKENGFAPRWVALEKEIRQGKAQLEKILINLKTRRERLVSLVQQYPYRREVISRTFEQERARSLTQYSEKLENLNQKIQRVNLLMPTRNRQYVLINRAQALTHFQKACPNL
jgi:DnaJ family protein C protein 28